MRTYYDAGTFLTCYVDKTSRCSQDIVRATPTSNQPHRLVYDIGNCRKFVMFDQISLFDEQTRSASSDNNETKTDVHGQCHPIPLQYNAIHNNRYSASLLPRNPPPLLFGFFSHRLAVITRNLFFIDNFPY